MSYINEGRVSSITVHGHDGMETQYHRALCRNGTWAIRSLVWDCEGLKTGARIAYTINDGLSANEAHRLLSAALKAHTDLGVPCSVTHEL